LRANVKQGASTSRVTVVTNEEAQRQFVVACGDADVDARTLAFFPFDHDADDEFSAFALLPDEKTNQGHRSLLDRTRWAEANDRTRARIFCWTGLDPRIIGPVLRHELEHVRQAEHHDGRRTMILAAGLMREAVLEETGYASVPGAPHVYNLNPAELDANGAGARFAFKLLGEEAYRLAALKEPRLDPGLLKRRPPPEPIDTLPLRLICHAAVWADEVLITIDRFGFAYPVLGLRPIDVAPPDARDFFEFVATGGQALWDRLANDSEFQVLRKAVPSTIPTASASAPYKMTPTAIEQAWIPAVLAVRAAVDRGRQLAGLGPTPQPDTGPRGRGDVFPRTPGPDHSLDAVGEWFGVGR
jgi:hypothetical protein